jgi:MoaA/NifB/PqqE/SkfB family radical SAM enzyme
MPTARPVAYDYYGQLVDHLGGDLGRIFDGTLVWPKQLEIHLPGDGRRRCNFNCAWCQGRDLDRGLADWEGKALGLIDALDGAIPLHIFGGAYTEQLLSSRLPEFLRLTKRHGNSFGIHTNGSLLFTRERSEGLLTEICQLADSPNDYVSVSLDAGFTYSHCRGKGLAEKWFGEIIDGLALLSWIRGRRRFPRIRLAYLMTEDNASEAEIWNAVRTAKSIGADSLRFSVPYHPYGADFARVRAYKAEAETDRAERFFQIVQPHIPGDGNGTRVFWMGPETQDVDALNYKQCIYSYWQITLAADGYVYRCSCTASPSFAFCRLGEIPGDIEAFNQMVMMNHNPEWRPEICFSNGARCNRQAIELNNIWRDTHEEIGARP